MKVNAVQNYEQYFHNGDRREIFRILADKYKLQSAMYPGSYIHIAPSLYIPITVYVDSYKKANEFFSDKRISSIQRLKDKYKIYFKLYF